MDKQPFVKEKEVEGFFIEKFVSGTDEKSFIEIIKRQWLEGDWDALAKISLNRLRPGEARVKLALLAAVGNLQIGKYEEARECLALAKKWRASKEIIKKVIISSIHNSLGRASIVAEDSNRAGCHFSESIGLDFFVSLEANEENISIRFKSQSNRIINTNNNFNYIIDDLFVKLENLMERFMSKGLNFEINGEKVINEKDVFLKGKIAFGAALYFKNTVLGPEVYFSRIQEFKKAFERLNNFPLETWGIFWFLKAVKIFDELNSLKKIFNESDLVSLKKNLNWREFVDEDSYKVHKKPNNFYGVAYAISLLRFQLGWDPYVHCQRLMERMVEHYRTCSGRFGFADETEGKGRYDRYSFLLIAEIASHMAEGEVQLTAEMKEWLRRSCEVVLHNLNMNGDGFSYGRSIGAYGDTAYMEILTAAVRNGLLSPEEIQAAYAFCCKCTQKFINFWWNDEWQSVDLWSSGRKTDAYRGIHRILGENFSLLYQHIYVHQHWEKLNFSVPISDEKFQEWLDLRPKYLLTRFSEEGNSCVMLTVRDGGKIFNLPLVNGDKYYRETPYFPIPFSSNLIQGVSGENFPQLTPRISIGNEIVLMPLAWYKNIFLTENAKGCVLNWSNSSLVEMNGTLKSNPTVVVKTKYIFEPGVIHRSDEICIKETKNDVAIELDFACFSEDPVIDGYSVVFKKGDIHKFTVRGFDELGAKNCDARYQGPEGPMSVLVFAKKHYSNVAIINCGYSIEYY